MDFKMKPRLLDTFCKAGGAGMGYHRAGFEVVGVDIEFQKRYPFEFHQGDALEYIRDHGHEFDVIHASPPCQAYTWASAKHRNNGKVYPDLVIPTREALDSTGKPYIIENVVGAILLKPFVLCGTMFGLKVIRHRQFEINPRFVTLIPQCFHNGSVPNGDYCTVAGHGGDGKASLKAWKEAMGIDWMNKQELTQAIPPAYCEFMGRQLLNFLRNASSRRLIGSSTSRTLDTSASLDRKIDCHLSTDALAGNGSFGCSCQTVCVETDANFPQLEQRRDGMD